MQEISSLKFSNSYVIPVQTGIQKWIFYAVISIEIEEELYLLGGWRAVPILNMALLQNNENRKNRHEISIYNHNVDLHLNEDSVGPSSNN